MDKQATIEAILQAARRPCPEIVPIRQVFCSNGNYYEPYGIPSNTQAVKPYEWRTHGYAYTDGNTTWAGKFFETEQAAFDANKAYEDSKTANFRKYLESATAKRLAEQASYWLK